MCSRSASGPVFHLLARRTRSRSTMDSARASAFPSFVWTSARHVRSLRILAGRILQVREGTEMSP